jgi:hypothetical protein
MSGGTMPGIDRREAAADIDDIGEDAGAHEGARGLGHGRLIGGRPHALAADVEGHAHQVLGGAPGGQQQGRGRVARTPNLPDSE